MRRRRTEPNITEWIVLAIAAEGATHGWAVAGLLRPGGPLGEAWSSSRPLVYRAIGRLIEDGLLRSAGRGDGRGPDREVFVITPAGSQALEEWLHEPVEHVRDLRTAFIAKLLLLARRGDDPGPLVAAQRDRLAPIAARLAAHATEAIGTDRIVASWRALSADAAMRFLDEVDRGR